MYTITEATGLHGLQGGASKRRGLQCMPEGDIRHQLIEIKIRLCRSSQQPMVARGCDCYDHTWQHHYQYDMMHIGIVAHVQC